MDDLIVRDGYAGSIPCFDPHHIVIDMDAVETAISQKAKKALDCSMDMSFALTNGSIINMMLVELKLNVVQPAQLSREKLDKKAYSSAQILSQGSIPIFPTHIFIFKDEKVKECRSRLNRMMPQVAYKYDVMSIGTLKALHFP